MKRITLMKTCLTALLTLTLLVNSQAQSKVKSIFGKGITVMAKDSSFKMKFSTRFQNLMISEMVLQDDFTNQKIATNFLVRRSRIKFDGFVHNPKIQYKMEFGLSNRDHAGEVPETRNTSNVVMDAVIKWNFAKNTYLWIGQTKLPGNRERVISSQKLQFVDRSLVNSRFNIDRDMGFQLRHHFNIGKMLFRESVAISQGEGRNITAGNQDGGLEYTVRVEFLPFGKFTGKGDYFASDLKREKKPKLSFGATFDHNNNTNRSRGNLGSFISDYRTLNTVFGDLMFKYKGFSLASEYANKQIGGGKSAVVSRNDDGSVNEFFYTGEGFVVQAGYLFKNNVELAARYTEINPDAGNGVDEIKEYTLGVSKYIVGHALKIQTDLSYKAEGTDDPGLRYRLQFELAF